MYLAREPYEDFDTELRIEDEIRMALAKG